MIVAGGQAGIIIIIIINILYDPGEGRSMQEDIERRVRSIHRQPTSSHMFCLPSIPPLTIPGDNEITHFLRQWVNNKNNNNIINTQLLYLDNSIRTRLLWLDISNK